VNKRYFFYFFPVLILIIIIGFSKPISSLGATISGTNFSVLNPVITNGLGSSSSANFGLGQSLGQMIVGKSASSNFQLWSGFQYYTVSTFTLMGTSSTSAEGSVVLIWTTPVISGNPPIIGYDVGVSTTPYSYTFEDVGNVHSFTKGGLINGVTYYFIIKAKTTGSFPVAFSNAVSVVPSGTNPVTPPANNNGGSTSYVPPSGGSVEITGMAYPNTKVTILKDGIIASVTTADPGAAFKVTISNLSAAYYNFGVYAIDTSGLKSPTYSFPVSISDFITIHIDNVFLAPTIGVSNTEIKKGDPINIFGMTVPKAEVTMYVHSVQEFVKKIISTSAGIWFKQFDTSVLDLGNHDTYSRASLNDRITDKSNVVAFTVGKTSIKGIVSYKRSDLNKDGKVNIIDFSMLLYYWNKKPPTTSRADINKDGIVDIIDLSIMLYDWTG
jgi:hypothetical protein